MRRLPLLLLLALPGAPVPGPPLTGLVRGTDGPIAGAVVRAQATALAVRTDAAGRFFLPRPVGSVRVTAAKDGYVIAATDIGSAPVVLRLQRAADEDDESYSWVDPTPDSARGQNCGNCHTTAYREWATSGHAN